MGIEIDCAAARRILSYDPETGVLVWGKVQAQDFPEAKCPAQVAKSWNSRWSGRVAFTSVNPDGYNVGHFLGRRVAAHRMAWLIVTGNMPQGQIDHINHNRLDNRICNLRDVSKLQNSRNQKKHATNTSGHCGVSYVKAIGKWHSYIGSGSSRTHLGFHRCITSAIVARELAQTAAGYSIGHGK